MTPRCLCPTWYSLALTGCVPLCHTQPIGQYAMRPHIYLSTPLVPLLFTSYRSYAETCYGVARSVRPSTPCSFSRRVSQSSRLAVMKKEVYILHGCDRQAKVTAERQSNASPAPGHRTNKPGRTRTTSVMGKACVNDFRTGTHRANKATWLKRSC